MPYSIDTNNPLVSIIIRTYNEEEKIRRCLTAVFRQKTKISYEVIVIDSGSDDYTLSIVKQFPRISIIRTNKTDFSYGRALNVAADQANGKYLACLSAHAIPDDNWLNHLAAGFNDQCLAGAYSRQVADNSRCPLTIRMLDDHHRKICRSTKPQLFFSNAGSMIAKNIWQKIPFNEQLKASEDYLWAQKACEAGYRISYQPQAVIEHWHQPDFQSIYQRNLREFSSLMAINHKKIILNLLILPIYNFLQDTIYICRKRLSPLWLLKSISINSAIMAASITATIKQNAHKH